MAEIKDFESIMKEITYGLKGTPEDDMKYLYDQMEKYRDHEYGKEIIRACGRLMYEVIPEDEKEEINKIIEKDEMGFEASLEEIRFNIYKKNYDMALKIAESAVHKYEEANLYANDSVSEYYCFTEAMEELLYKQYNKPEKDLRQAQIDYAELYFLYGSLLVEMEHIEDAEVVLEKAKRWNPVNARIAFEHAETFKMRGMTEEFVKLTKDIFKYAFRPDDLARCYRNLAYYYTEKEEYKAAVCCLLYSGMFQKSEIISSELYYISRKTGELYQPTEEELTAIFEKYDIPKGPETEMLKMAYSYGRYSYEQGNAAGAEYFFGIFAAFVNDEEVNKILEKITWKS